MSLSRFPTNPADIIVADASVLINLNATGHFEAIIRSFVCNFHVTQNAFEELKRGSRNGHADASAVETLMKAGLLTVVALTDAAEPVYRSLIEGPASETLDDGGRRRSRRPTLFRVWRLSTRRKRVDFAIAVSLISP